MRIYVGDTLQWVNIHTEEISEYIVMGVDPPLVRQLNDEQAVVCSMEDHPYYRNMSLEEIIRKQPVRDNWIIKLKSTPFEQFVRETLEKHDKAVEL